MLHDPKKEARIAEELFHNGLAPWQRYYLDAAELIKKGGWTQNSYYNSRGHCAVGAIGRVIGGIAHFTGLRVLTLRVLRPLAIHVDSSSVDHLTDMDFLVAAIIGWNDASLRRETEVVKTLQLVALG